ncbi:DUF1194 domain-containing protein [Pararhodobacter oceanensis]|uniref:DUF1194 domain-containing protein n=1 Tax=Pararhodobacter oceanensis TaxID=2172121 RepID=UPI003A92C1BB
MVRHTAIPASHLAGRRFRLLVTLWIAAAALCLAPAAAAQSTPPCRLALLLAFDVSASVSAREYQLMMRGTASALIDPQVRAAIFAGPPVALAAYVWAGRREQAIAAFWSVIHHPEDLAEFAGRIGSFPRPVADPLQIWGGRTGVGAALAAGERLIRNGPTCDAHTLDVAGDGPSNDGPESARLEGITVNGLAIGGDIPLDHYEGTAGLSLWYAEYVLQGPGAFVMIADGYEDFAAAMQRKLLRELMPPLLGALNR